MILKFIYFYYSYDGDEEKNYFYFLLEIKEIILFIFFEISRREKKKIFIWRIYPKSHL